jgi:hypothetical protein
LIVQIAAVIPDSIRAATVRNLAGDGAESAPNSRADWFLENRALTILRNRGFAIYVSDSLGRANDSGAIIEFKLVEIGIAYTRHDKQRELVRRTANLHFMGRMLLASTGEVLYNENLRASKTDWIASAEQKSYENETIDFTVGKVSESKHKSSIVQPIVITVATGVVVYLFYALRSR